MRKFFVYVVCTVLMSINFAFAQFINDSGTNPAISEYEQEMQEMYPDSNAMLDRGIMYVFYNGQNCTQCAEAMQMIYEVYSFNYEADFALFEIDYTQDNGENFQQIYDLTQPLSVVLVHIHDGQAWGYEKINNLINWVNQPQYFKQMLMNEINNFLA